MDLLNPACADLLHHTNCICQEVKVGINIFQLLITCTIFASLAGVIFTVILQVFDYVHCPFSNIKKLGQETKLNHSHETTNGNRIQLIPNYLISKPLLFLSKTLPS